MSKLKNKLLFVVIASIGIALIIFTFYYIEQRRDVGTDRVFVPNTNSFIVSRDADVVRPTDFITHTVECLSGSCEFGFTEWRRIDGRVWVVDELGPLDEDVKKFIYDIAQKHNFVFDTGVYRIHKNRRNDSRSTSVEELDSNLGIENYYYKLGGSMCEGDLECATEHSCWYELPSNARKGIYGTTENPGRCIKDDIIQNLRDCEQCGQ